jgi:diaminopimelate decarboxylase
LTSAGIRTRSWWIRDGLEVVDGRLHFAGHDTERIARQHGTPLYVYDPQRLEANVGRLQAALGRAGVRHRVHYALKANRHPAYLSRLRLLGTIGIDACSPQEVSLAVGAGWKPEEISYTGTNLSERDLDVVLAHPVILNLDSLSAIRRVGGRVPGRAIGLRINPQVGTGYSPQLTYAGDKPTKFGIYPDRFAEALDLARQHGLAVQGLHFHIGSGWLRSGLDAFLEALERGAHLARRVAGIEYFNVGGGLGIPLQQSDRGVDLDAYAQGIAHHLGALGVTVFVEPGDYLAKDTAVLLVEVVSVEDKGGVRFVGVDCGFNAFGLPVMYHYHQEIVLCRAADAPPTMTCTVAGHINEAGDLFAEGCRLPEVREGDVLAFLSAGGYAASMASGHCARPPAAEVVVATSGRAGSAD